MPHILDDERSMVIPCVDPEGAMMTILQDAYELEMKRSAKAGKKQKNDLRDTHIELFMYDEDWEDDSCLWQNLGNEGCEIRWEQNDI